MICHLLPFVRQSMAVLVFMEWASQQVLHGLFKCSIIAASTSCISIFNPIYSSWFSSSPCQCDVCWGTSTSSIQFQIMIKYSYHNHLDKLYEWYLFKRPPFYNTWNNVFLMIGLLLSLHFVFVKLWSTVSTCIFLYYLYISAASISHLKLTKMELLHFAMKLFKNV